MAAARAAVKLGSFVKEEAICSAKNFWNSEELNFIGWAWASLPVLVLVSILVGLGVSFVMLLGLGFARSRVTVGTAEPKVGTEPRVGATLRLTPEPGVASG